MAETIDRYLETATRAGLFSSIGNLRFHLSGLFDGIDLSGRSVLDIGGGSGLHTFYAAAAGARDVVCLEPEAEGSTSSVVSTFRRVQGELGYTNVTLEPVTFQEFDSHGRVFDVILVHDAINHLNEPACINLLKSTEARAVYQGIFKDLFGLCSPRGKLVIADCSRHNFFAAIGMRNPFTPTIEWEKHQAPEVWASMLRDVGFANPRVRWTTVNRFRVPGRVLTGNRWASYFLTSHFVLTMDRP